MEFGLAVVLGVAVISAVVGSLLTKGCCGTKKGKDVCGSAPLSSHNGFEDSDKEKAIDELMSKKDT